MSAWPTAQRLDPRRAEAEATTSLEPQTTTETYSPTLNVSHWTAIRSAAAHRKSKRPVKLSDVVRANDSR